jgi:hypothetical protein
VYGERLSTARGPFCRCNPARPNGPRKGPADEKPYWNPRHNAYMWVFREATGLDARLRAGALPNLLRPALLPEDDSKSGRRRQQYVFVFGE